MRETIGVASAGDIIEGDPLHGDRLAAVFSWPNTAFPPLLRINYAYVPSGLIPAVWGWALAMQAQDQPLAVLPVNPKATRAVDAPP